MIKPTEDINSECFECNAGMCHICSFKNEWDSYENSCKEDIRDYIDDESNDNVDYDTEYQTILKCSHCKTEYWDSSLIEFRHFTSGISDLSELKDYRLNENGTRSLICKCCGKDCLKEEKILVKVERKKDIDLIKLKNFKKKYEKK